VAGIGGAAVVTTWLTAAFTGIGVAIMGAMYNEIRDSRTAINRLGQRLARLEGRLGVPEHE
jgi:hypothetical protein